MSTDYWAKVMKQNRNEKRSLREKWKRQHLRGTKVVWTGPTGIKYHTEIASSPWYQHSDLFVNVKCADKIVAVRCDALVKRDDQ